MRIALVETKPSSTDYSKQFEHNFAFDQYALCSNPDVKKVLKRDCDINIDLDAYDWVILVGSDALKYFTKEGSVTLYSGKKVGEKFLPIINPAMLAFKPEAKSLWERSKSSIIDYIEGNVEEVVVDDSIAFGIQDTDKAIKFLQEALDHPKDYVAYDCETTNLYPRNGYIQGISLCYDGKKAAYISTDCLNDKAEELLRELFRTKTIILHNAKFDLGFAYYYLNVPKPQFEDTMLLHYLIDENPGTHGLKELAVKYTPYGNYEKPMGEWITNFCKENRIKKADFSYEWIPFDVMYPYAAMDALATYTLYDKFKKIKQNKKLKKVYDDILIPGTKFLIEMQDNGVPFDKGRLGRAQDLMQKEIDEAINKLYEHPEVEQFEKAQGKEFNPNSVVQLRTLMFDYLGLKPTGLKTPKGADSTNAEALKLLSEQSEIPDLILNIRQKSKIKNTYLDKIIPELDADSRLRTGFNLHTTTSGRLSSSGKLNMQQLPRDNPIVKGCIKARPGYVIVSMDLQTAEVYVAAVLSGDTNLMKVFTSGGDFHSTIAKTIFRLPCAVEEVADKFPLQRQAAKAVSFGIMYGAGPQKISDQVTKDSGKYYSMQQAAEVIDDYFNNFPKLRKWINDNKEFIMQNGFIYSHFGRKRRLPNVRSRDRGVQGHNIRSGLNFLVQSAASDINLLGAIDANEILKAEHLDASIFALVHDSILAEVWEENVDLYCDILMEHVQKDRGIMIPGCPIKCDFAVHEDYSMGKYSEKYE